MKIGFVGAGVMGSTIAEGVLKDHKIDNDKVFIYDQDHSKLDHFNDFCSTNDKLEDVLNCEIIVLAIKPQQYKEWLEEYADKIQDKTLVSIAAGISSEFLKKHLQKFVIVMPNTPALINKGYTSIVENNYTSDAEYSYVVDIFERVGDVKIIKEDQLEIMIAMAGSAPAYNFFFLEVMSAFGVKHGLTYEESYEIAASVMSGASEKVLLSHNDPATLKTRVCSPNGTTIEAVKILENSDISEVVNNAMEACYNRAKEIKKENDNK